MPSFGDGPALRILFVAFQDSIHVAQWIKLLDGAGYDIHLYCSHIGPVNEELHDITVHAPHLVHYAWEDRFIHAMEWCARRLEALRFPHLGAHVKRLQESCRLRAIDYRAVGLDFSGPRCRSITVRYTSPPIPTVLAAILEAFARRLHPDSEVALPSYGPRLLRRAIRKIRPDIIHSMEFQLNGYLTMQARDGWRGPFPTWIASNYGSDLYYFRRFPEHERKLRRLLSHLDYYSCECRRDLRIARELGLTAPALAVIPNSGGIDFAKIQRTARVEPTSRRRVIAVKGYENWSGRATLALQGLAACEELLSEYEIVVYKPDFACTKYVESLADMKLHIRILPYTSHARLLELFGHSRLYIGISLSDGISTAMLEAMAMGAFPIQTCTSCADEWLENGRSAFIVPPDVNAIAERVREALTNDALVDSAAMENWKTCAERADSRQISKTVVAQYEAIRKGTVMDLQATAEARSTAAETFSPKVSIIIPVYNGSNYLRDAIDSALNQTYRNFEVIVVNDGSTDDGRTREVALSYGDRIRYFQKTNGGVASALNLGIANMTGSYFSWLSHDDAYKPEKISCQIDYLRREPDPENVVFYSDYEVMNEHGSFLYACRWDHHIVSRKPIYSLLRGLIHGCSLLIPKSLFMRFRTFDESLRATQDYDLWFDLIRRVPFKHIPEVLVRSRWHAEQDTKTRSSEYVVKECNALWTRFQTELTDAEMLSCEETKGRFFWELARFLETTPYDEARALAYRNAVEKAAELKVSVIIPFCDRLALTERAVDSARKQTHGNLEIIAVDDGSTESVERLRALAREDQRLLYLRQGNAGAGTARNAGLRRATGDFVAFLDSDDWWEPTKTEVQLRAMVANNWAVSHTSYVRAWIDGREEPIHSAQDGRLELPGMIASCPICPSTVMARRDVFGKHAFPPRPGEDVIAWLDIATEWPFWGVDLPLVRMHASQQSTAFDVKKNLIGMRSIFQFVAEDPRFAKYPEALRSLAADVQALERRAGASMSKMPEKGATMKRLLKGIAMWVPPVRWYVERHRAIFRDFVALQVDHARLTAERAGVLESLVGQIGALSASVQRLGSEFAEPLSLQAKQTISGLSALSSEVAHIREHSRLVSAAVNERAAELSRELDTAVSRVTADVAAVREESGRAVAAVLGKFDQLSEQLRSELTQRSQDLLRDAAATRLNGELWYRDVLAVLSRPDVLRGGPRFAITTEHPVAVDSDDHLIPWGTQVDNTRWPRFVKACETLIGRYPLWMMDLGCAGGGLVLDFLLAGHSAVGIEGSDVSLTRRRAEWRTIPHNLFTADITKPFTVRQVGRKDVANFHIITAWDVMEHIRDSDLEGVFANINRHLHRHGFFIGTIAVVPDENKETGAVYHRTVRPQEWWIARFAAAGLEILKGASLRHDDYCRGIGNPYNPNDGDYRRLPGTGFQFVARKLGADKGVW